MTRSEVTVENGDGQTQLISVSSLIKILIHHKSQKDLVRLHQEIRKRFSGKMAVASVYVCVMQKY